MTRPQLRLIKGGKKESPDMKWDTADKVGLAAFGTLIGVGGTILRKALSRGRL